MLYWGLAASGMVLSLIALIHDQQQIYFIALTVVALPWLSRGMSSGVRRSLRASLQTSGEIKVHQGEQASTRVAIHNSGRMPRVLCRASLDLPEGLRETREQADQVDTLAPESATHLDVSFVAERRGCYRLRTAKVQTTDVMGIFEYAVELDQIDIDVTVWPHMHNVTRIPWLDDQSGELDSLDSRTANDSSSHGEVATDFFGIREYVPGDEIRRIHWPSTARHQAFTVIEYVSQHRGMVNIFLDVDGSRYPGQSGATAFEEAVSMAATIAKVAISEGMPIRLIAPGPSDYGVAAQEGTTDLELVLDQLAAVQADGSTRLDLLVLKEGRTAQGGGIVLITGRADETLANAQRAAASLGVPCRALVIDLDGGESARANGGAGTFVYTGEDDPVRFLRSA